MEKKRTITIILGGLLIVLAAISFAILNKKNDEETDAIRFKKEYEALNGTIRESDGAKYNDVIVDEDNPFIYIDAKEAIDVIDNKNAIIYVGAAWCPWCRNAIPVLVDVAKKNNIKEIYYLNLDEEKSVWEVEDGKAVKKIKGTDNYYKLLEKLKDNLRDYTLKDDAGKVLDTGEKRIYMPYVIGVKRGTVVSEHTGTVDLDDSQTKYDYLTKDQEKELYNSYQKIFDEVYQNTGGSCNKDGECE